MNVIELPIDRVVPYERNPRKNDKAVEAVANSIKEFGFKVPIIIDANNVVVAGHTRLKAVKKAQWPAKYSYDKGADWWLKKNAKKYGYKYSATGVPNE